MNALIAPAFSLACMIILGWMFWNWWWVPRRPTCPKCGANLMRPMHWKRRIGVCPECGAKREDA